MSGQRTVLVVEDNPITQKMMVVTLRAAGYRVLAASQGQQALEYFERESPDLVVQDLVLPDMDGIELARQIRARPNGRDTALVALSGLASMLETAQSSAHGFAGCLFKPVEPSRLVIHLAEILRPDATSPKSDTPPRRVLLVDDDPVLLKLARLRLEECGFAVTGADDGEQALATARLERPDAIVTDLLMPGLDGLDLCRKAREDAVLGQVPIIIMSASAPPEHLDDLKLARAAGANAFVARTPSFDAVVRALDECLSTTDRQAVTPGLDLTRLRNEFNGRLVQHLDRQASLNQTLGREAASKTAQLSILTAVADVLARGGRIDTVLTDILARTLDATGVSIGAIYLASGPPHDGLTLACQVGYPLSRIRELGEFFERRDLLDRAMTGDRIVTVAGSELRDALGASTHPEGMSCTLVPLAYAGQRVGVLFLADAANRSGADWGEIARTLSVQIAQAVTVARSIEQLSASEDRYRTLFERVPVALYRSTPDGQLVDVNTAMVELLGYPDRATLLAASVSTVYARPHERTVLRERLERERIVRGFETELRQSDGTVVWVRIAAHAVSNGSPDGTYFEGSIEDISEARRVAAARTEQGKLDALAATVGLAVAAGDAVTETLARFAEAVVRHVNVALVRIWTIGPGEKVLLLRTSAGLDTSLDGIDARIPVGEREIGRIALKRRPMVSNAVVGNAEIWDQAWAAAEGMVAFAGHPLIVDERVVGVGAVWARHALSEATLRTLAAVADTLALGIERKRAQEALAESERLLRSVIDGTSDVVFVKDLAGRYVIANAAAAAMAGRSVEEMIGRSDQEIFPREFADRVHTADATVLATGVARTYEDVIVTPDTGKSITLLTTKGLYRDRTGRVAGVFGLARDITQHRQLEMELRQAQKMEAVGRLAGGIAHDFNNLLSIIMSYAGMLSADGPDSVSDPRDVNEIMQAANRAAGLTRQLLAFSRQQVLEPRLLDLNELVTGVQKMLQRIIGEDIKIVTELASELGHVRADPGQLEQVMLNLAVNARDAMPTGGVLTVTTQQMALDTAQVAPHPDMAPGRYVALAVSDTGIGMDETTRARIFEPFFTTKEKGKGTGLGLSTVYGIVHQSSGFITVDSRVGHGTTFRVFLPFVGEISSTRVATPVGTEIVSVAHETILLIEDEDTLRRVAGHVLERGGYTLLMASNGAEAMALAAQHTGRIDLIVTDVVMPGLNGREVVERLAPMHPEAKVLFMSGYTDDTVLRLGIIESKTPFMQKPFSALALARKVQELLRGESGKESPA